jgi:hypothetical protein
MLDERFDSKMGKMAMKMAEGFDRSSFLSLVSKYEAIIT